MATDLQGIRVLVIDDDVDLLQLLGLIFAQAGAQVFSAVGGREGLRQFYARQPDLVLVDMLMPELDGLQVCERIRGVSSVPIIILTAMSRESDVVRALNGGADDYITKPFSAQVLLARARTVLRRVEPSLSPERATTYDDGYLTIDLDQRQVLVQGEPATPSPTEYKLLAFLLQHAGRVLTYEQILNHVWNGTSRQRVEYVHVYVTYLRRKLEPNPKHPVYLLNEHGVGYRFQGKPHRESIQMGTMSRLPVKSPKRVAEVAELAVAQ